MQKISLVLSIIALTLVGYLLVNRTASTEEDNATPEVTEIAEPEADVAPGTGLVAFINIDTINAEFKFLDDKLKVLQDEQSRSERRMANKLRKAEEEFMKLQEDARFMTENERMQAEQTIQQSQVDLQSYQEKLANDLIKLEGDIQADLQGRIMRAVEDVNAAYGYDYVLAKSAGGGILVGKADYDLTTEVLELLNSRYAEELAAEKTEKK